MPKANLYDMAGKQIGEVELSEAIFGIEPNQYVVHDVVKNHLANCRQGTQSALTRAEVSGGGRKPWKQKGTGRARQGSTRAPQWTHGGIVFAPKTKDFAKFLSAVGCTGKTLVVTAEPKQNVVLSGRNIAGCQVTFANLINVYDVLNAGKLVVDRAALAKIEEVFA